MRYQTMIVSALVGMLAPWVGEAKDKRDFTADFPLAACAFETEGVNPYFMLKVGRTLHYDNLRCVTEGKCDEIEVLSISVLNETHDIVLEIDGVERTVTTRVVEEREAVEGTLSEVSRNYFAECAGTQDVYYFGEDVDIYQDGEIVSHDGAWSAGINGAMPGIVMPGGAFLLGARYFQEVAPDVAMDRAEHVGSGLEAEVPAGEFDACVEVEETTPLEKKALSRKVYCSGIGLIIDDDVELIRIEE